MKHSSHGVFLHHQEPGTPFYGPSQEVYDAPTMRVLPSPISPFTMPAACTFIRHLHLKDDTFPL